ncbi:MAG TPA: DUF885 domain-containing protein [Thermoanaerobaculia bacterium]|jgi:uncharacterized protein (DUF885 family)
MNSPLLALATLLLAPPALPASTAVPPDLAEAARQIERFAASRGQESESARLERFFDLYWATRLREFPDVAIAVGYPGLGDRWPDRSPEALALIHRIARLELAALSAIDRSRLSAAEQVDYDLARRRLEMQIEGERFHELEPFRNELLLIHPMSGIDQDLVELLAYLPARTVEDYATLLARLRGFPAAVDQTLARLGQGLAAGITPPRVTLRNVPERVRSLLVDDPWQSPVLAPFEKLPETIPAPERERLRREAARVFTEQVAPALRRLHDYLANTYVPGARESIAMSDLPDGKAWYAYQLRVQTTTGLSPEQIHQLGLAEVRRIRGEMDALIAATGFKGSFAEFSRFLRTDPRFFYDRPEDLVAGYRDIAKRIDPELVKLFGRLPRLPYGVKALEGAAAKSAPAGYYNNGSLAGGLPGWFLVNTYDLKSRPKWAMEALALHESVPGHHLQYALAEELEDLPEWRKWDVYPAFSEGWALYAEGLGSEVGLYQDPYAKFGRLTNEVWRAIRLVADTGLHAFGWTRQQAIDYYQANSAKSAHDIEVEVDRIIVQPGTVPVYKLGELKIRELRSYAQQELGPRFDLRAFHDHLLGHGQLPLDLLEKSVKAWVAEVKAHQNATVSE